MLERWWTSPRHSGSSLAEDFFFQFRYGITLRSMILLLAAYVWLIVGIGVYTDSAATPDNAFHLLIPPHVRAAAWAVSAALALLCVFFPVRSNLGLAALMVMPCLRVTSYLWAWVVHLVPGEPYGYENGWYNSVIHLSLVGLVAVGALIPARLTIRDLRALASFARHVRKEGPSFTFTDEKVGD